jgi:tRNA(Ile2) C34 agmatinyltransferase TiaS
MLMMKSCPRCHGDVIGGRDGEFSCIQCGHELRTDERTRLLLRLRLAEYEHEAAVSA